MVTVFRNLLVAVSVAFSFYVGAYLYSPPYRPNYIFAEPNYLNFYFWSNGEGKFQFRDILKNSEYKFDKVCASGEGGVPPYEVRNSKPVSGVELNDPLSMSYLSLYLLGEGSYSVMNFDPLDVAIDWPFSGCQPIEGLSLEIHARNGYAGITYTIRQKT
ncbi:hypothetical protein GR197_12095 [Rhizobium phaseoli]|uniref:Uncharacterized protein n=1 Tax=Rhizobium phaseoli TaxID=396 RepID=A0A7K3UCX4_9HYPH|nr:hypothetical protein [Rhizobium phaseoli]NEJ71271.1 hypothetical protein [Rhizobium phaseoli]